MILKVNNKILFINIFMIALIFILPVSFAETTNSETNLVIENLTNNSNNPESSLNVVKKIEENLLFSNEVLEPEDPSNIIINKGGWDLEDTQNIEGLTIEKQTNTIAFEKVELKEDKETIAKKRKAFNAITNNQYEIAVKLYKEVLEKNKDDAYANLGLATAYQYLNEYTQAKPLYLVAAEDFPDDQQITTNLLSIIINESPYEAVYLISSIANKNQSSPLYQAQASLAYTEVKNYNKALEYIEKAIALDENNIEYKYNLAVLYDLNGDLEKANYLYGQLLQYPEDYMANGNFLSNKNYILPRQEIQERINEIKYLNSKNS